MTNDQKQQHARTFLSVLGKPDEEVLRTVVTDDVVWSFPGESRISGEAKGVDGIIERARAIAGHGVKVELLHTTYGFGSGIAIILHNTGARNDRVLDEHLTTVFAFEGDRIVRLDTYLSDVAMAEAFFA